jgi:hypothetical protein
MAFGDTAIIHQPRRALIPGFSRNAHLKAIFVIPALIAILIHAHSQFAIQQLKFR